MNSITVIRGDTTAIGITLSNVDGSVYWLHETDIARFIIFDGKEPVLRKEITGDMQEAESGVINVQLDPADTETLHRGMYRFEMEIVTADGTVITPISGQVIVKSDLITPDKREDD